MTTRMLINATARNELRIAIVEDGDLIELDIEAAETSTIKGNIYKGVVHNVEGSLEAAFVDFGAHKQGFLPFSEISPLAYHKKPGADRPRIQDVMKRGQDIVVQVAKDAVGDKGATLTTYLSLAGRYTVLMPGSDAQGVSRKIEDEKLRRRLKSMVSRVKKPAGCGFIVRTAGLNQTRIGIQKDLDVLHAHYQKVMKSASIARAPSIIHAEPDLIARTLRDYFNDEIDEVWIDDAGEYEAAVAYFEKVMPEDVERLHHYQNPIPIFAYYHVEEQIEATFERRVSLASGGSIVIDETEALVAIDVNSGRMTSERDHEETVFKTNCEAAEAIARQLKLRDLGGIVVADFIDMEESRNKRAVENVLAEAAKEDKARWKISRINSKGLCVFTRQRIRQGMRRAFQRRCTVCDGTGWVRTAESHSLSLLRRLEARLAQGGVGEARVTTHRETAEYLLNQKRNALLSLEREFNCAIVVIARPDIDRGKDEVVFLSMGAVLAEITERLPPREERLRERERRKKKRKKRKERERAAASANVNGQAVQPELFDADEEVNGRKKRRRKRKRGGEGIEAAEVPAGDQAEAQAAEEPAVSADEVAAEVAPSVGQIKPVERKQLREKGTTFTGRPSPELLEQLKAARKARLAARGAKAPVVAPVLPTDPLGFDVEAEAMDAEAAAALDPPATDPLGFDVEAEAMDAEAAAALDQSPADPFGFDVEAEAMDPEAAAALDQPPSPSGEPRPGVAAGSDAALRAGGNPGATYEPEARVIDEPEDLPYADEVIELTGDDDSEDAVGAAAADPDEPSDRAATDSPAESAVPAESQPKRRGRRSSTSRRRSARVNDEGASAADPSPDAAARRTRAGPVPRRVEPGLARRPAPEPKSDPAEQKARNRFLSRLFGS